MSKGSIRIKDKKPHQMKLSSMSENWQHTNGKRDRKGRTEDAAGKRRLRKRLEKRKTKKSLFDLLRKK